MVAQGHGFAPGAANGPASTARGDGPEVEAARARRGQGDARDAHPAGPEQSADAFGALEVGGGDCDDGSARREAPGHPAVAAIKRGAARARAPGEAEHSARVAASRSRSSPLAQARRGFFVGSAGFDVGQRFRQGGDRDGLRELRKQADWCIERCERRGREPKGRGTGLKLAVHRGGNRGVGRSRKEEGGEAGGQAIEEKVGQAELGAGGLHATPQRRGAAPEKSPGVSVANPCKARAGASSIDIRLGEESCVGRPGQS